MNRINLTNIPNCCGIYKFTNIITGKIYIGSAINLRKRFVQHRSSLRLGTHHSIYFQNAYNKYGESNFVYNILEYVTDKTDLLLREQYYLDTILFAQDYINKKSNKFLELGYNLNPIAKNRFGSKQKTESIIKSIINNKRVHSVLQFDFNGNFIEEFISAGDAAKKLNIDRTGIWACCKGNQEYCNKYFFIYKKDLNIYKEYFESLKNNPYIPIIWNKNKHYKLNKNLSFIMFDRYGRYIGQYSNLYEISKVIHSSVSNISRCKNVKRLKNYYIFDINYNYNSIINELIHQYNFININNMDGNIIMYDVFNNIIRAFKSVKEASEITNINSNSIYNVLCKKRIQIKGFKFKYRDDIV